MDVQDAPLTIIAYLPQGGFLENVEPFITTVDLARLSLTSPKTRLALEWALGGAIGVCAATLDDPVDGEDKKNNSVAKRIFGNDTAFVYKKVCILDAPDKESMQARRVPILSHISCRYLEIMAIRWTLPHDVASFFPRNLTRLDIVLTGKLANHIHLPNTLQECRMRFHGCNTSSGRTYMTVTEMRARHNKDIVIGAASYLRVLHLSNFGPKDECLVNVIFENDTTPSRLQSLTLIHVFIDVSELFTKSMVTLSNLQHLKVVSDMRNVRIPLLVPPHVEDMTMTIYHHFNSDLDYDRVVYPHSLTRLHMVSSLGTTLYNKIPKTCPNLKRLTVSDIYAHTIYAKRGRLRHCTREQIQRLLPATLEEFTICDDTVIFEVDCCSGDECRSLIELPLLKTVRLCAMSDLLVLASFADLSHVEHLIITGEFDDDDDDNTNNIIRKIAPKARLYLT